MRPGSAAYAEHVRARFTAGTGEPWKVDGTGRPGAFQDGPRAQRPTTAAALPSAIIPRYESDVYNAERVRAWYWLPGRDC